MSILILLAGFYLVTVGLSYGYMFATLQSFDPNTAKQDYMADRRFALLHSLKGPLTLNDIFTNDYYKHGLKFW